VTASDKTDGWYEVPAAKRWTCPRCGITSDVALWRECEPCCEDCGSHDGRECPECGEVFDHVWGAAELAGANQ
jgi:hypothetical protein